MSAVSPGPDPPGPNPPPFRSFAALPLHGAILPRGYYYACRFPERPFSKGTVYDWRCWACTLHGQATLHNNGDQTMGIGDKVHNDSKRSTMLSKMVERALAWHAAQATPGRPVRESREFR